MARPRLAVPSYRKHSSGRAVISVYTSNGARKEILLPGKFGSIESKEEYARILKTIKTGDCALPTRCVVAGHDLTVAELVLKFMAHAASYYVDPITEKPTSEIAALSAAMKPLVRLYGDVVGEEFGPMALQTLRSEMLSGSWLSVSERAQYLKAKRSIGLARSTCNKNINRVKMLFKWAASMEFVSPGVYHALACVSGLRRGRSGARETDPVTPVSPAVIDETLPLLPPVVKDMVQILLLTGMRCGELCIMRPCDLDVSENAWVYRPQRHKGTTRGRQRVIAIGPRARAIIEKYLSMGNDGYVFSPAVQDELIRAQRREKRKTPLYPSHEKRLSKKRVPKGKRRPREHFDTGSINRAIGRACKRGKIPKWHVHQLRHSASLAFSRELGLEAARAALGHATVNMSAMYAGHDLQRAKEVAEKLG